MGMWVTGSCDTPVPPPLQSTAPGASVGGRGSGALIQPEFSQIQIFILTFGGLFTCSPLLLIITCSGWYQDKVVPPFQFGIAGCDSCHFPQSNSHVFFFLCLFLFLNTYIKHVSHFTDSSANCWHSRVAGGLIKPPSSEHLGGPVPASDRTGGWVAPNRPKWKILCCGFRFLRYCSCFPVLIFHSFKLIKYL